MTNLVSHACKSSAQLQNLTGYSPALLWCWLTGGDWSYAHVFLTDNLQWPSRMLFQTHLTFTIAVVPLSCTVDVVFLILVSLRRTPRWGALKWRTTGWKLHAREAYAWCATRRRFSLQHAADSQDLIIIIT